MLWPFPRFICWFSEFIASKQACTCTPTLTSNDFCYSFSSRQRRRYIIHTNDAWIDMLDVIVKAWISRSYSYSFDWSHLRNRYFLAAATRGRFHCSLMGAPHISSKQHFHKSQSQSHQWIDSISRPICPIHTPFACFPSPNRQACLLWAFLFFLKITFHSNSDGPALLKFNLAKQNKVMPVLPLPQLTFRFCVYSTLLCLPPIETWASLVISPPTRAPVNFSQRKQNY